MKISKIEKILQASRLFDTAAMDSEVEYAFASDLMSDVLAFALATSLLITGLTNIQIIRTATMLDMTGIVFVRNKRPLEEAIVLAKKLDIPILLCQKSMFETCGLLYQAGLKPCPILHKESS
ncbi:transcriptional regulator [Acetomicrobium sp. UBA5826]|uniref:transcriptional regulator n=1 Tax=Acetomicrobium sp. UBA5826 TaxID=1946039 RepID=UPI00257F53BA|nr:transcriptional regulator [Acetomicrobium sp. UBA5826]